MAESDSQTQSNQILTKSRSVQTIWVDPHHSAELCSTAVVSLDDTYQKIIDVLTQQHDDIDMVVSTTEYEIRCQTYNVTEEIRFTVSLLIDQDHDNKHMLECRPLGANSFYFRGIFDRLIQSFANLGLVPAPLCIKHKPPQLKKASNMNDEKSLLLSTEAVKSLVNMIDNQYNDVQQEGWHALGSLSTDEKRHQLIAEVAKTSLLKNICDPLPLRHRSALIIICNLAKTIPQVLQWEGLLKSVSEQWNTYLHHTTYGASTQFFPHVIRYIACFVKMYRTTMATSMNEADAVIVEHMWQELQQIQDKQTQQHL